MEKLKNKILIWLGIGKKKTMNSDMLWGLFFNPFCAEDWLGKQTVWGSIEGNEKNIDELREELTLIKNHLKIQIVEKSAEKVVKKVK